MKHRLTVLALVCFAATGYGKTLVVNNSSANTSNACKGATYTTISSAVAAASPGDTVDVCPGLYPEAVYINTANLKLVGISSNGSHLILLEPATGISASDVLPSGDDFYPSDLAVVEVDSVSGVEINNIFADGSMLPTTACATSVDGFLFRNASGQLENSGAAFLAENVDEDCQYGFGVFAQSGSGGTSKVTVSGTSVHDYNTMGILGVGQGTTLTAENNAVTANGVTQQGSYGYGISAAYGALGNVNHNVITGDAATIDEFQVGVYFYEAANSPQINYNTISDNIFGVIVQGSDHATVRYNNISKSIAGGGTEVYGDYADVQDNIISRAGLENGYPAIYYCGSHGHIACNTINEAVIGIVNDVYSGDDCTGKDNSIGNNSFYNVGLDQEWYNGGGTPSVRSNAMQSLSSHRSIRRPYLNHQAK